MMAFSFRKFTNFLDEGKCLPEIAKPEAPFNVASFIWQLPIWGLCMKALSLLARERRNSPATGSTGFVNKLFGHAAFLSWQLRWQTAKVSCDLCSQAIEEAHSYCRIRLDQLNHASITSAWIR